MEKKKKKENTPNHKQLGCKGSRWGHLKLAKPSPWIPKKYKGKHQQTWNINVKNNTESNVILVGGGEKKKKKKKRKEKKPCKNGKAKIAEGRCRSTGAAAPCQGRRPPPQEKTAGPAGLWSASCSSSFQMNKEPGFAAREVREGTLREEEWFLSAEANGQAVPLPAPPGVAVILCVRVCVSTVRQSSVVDQWWIVEALHIELCSILKTDWERK